MAHQSNIATEARRCEMYGRRCFRIAAIWIADRSYLVCFTCADEHEEHSRHGSPNDLRPEIQP
jgi:hypothetical protein